MAEMKTFNGYEVVDAKARQDIASHDTRITEVEKFFEAADTNGVIDKLAEVQKYIEDDAQAATELIQSIADVDAKVDAIHIPEKVSELENDKGYLTEHQSLEGKADKEHTHPQYLTEHQSLDNYYTKAQTDSAIGEAVGGIKIPEVDLTPYAKVADMPTKVSQLENDANYLTEHQSLDGKADKVHTHKLNEITDYKEPDLSEYAKKTDIPDVSKFITEVPAEYVTETELNNKGYLTEHQSLAGYATEQYVDDAIAGIDEGDSFFLDFSGATEEEQSATDELIAFMNHLKSHNNTACLYLKDRYHNIFLPASFNYAGSGLYLCITAASIVNVTDPIDYIFVREESGNYYYSISSSVDNPYTTKAYVDDAISGIEFPETDLTGYATEQYVDSTKMAILDIYNCKTTTGYVLTDNVKNIVQRLWDGGRFPIVVAPYSHLQYIPSHISVTSDEIEITLDTSHGTTGGKLTQLSTDTYVFTNTNGIIKLEVQKSSTDVIDSYEYSQQLAALEARVAALEGNN